MGRYLAKITADVLGKAPVRDSWNYQNSESVEYKMKPKKYTLRWLNASKD